MAWQKNLWLPHKTPKHRVQSRIWHLLLENYISINTSSRFIHLLVGMRRAACSCSGEAVLQSSAFISLVFFQSAIISREYDELRSPRASYEAFQGEISDFFFFSLS